MRMYFIDCKVNLPIKIKYNCPYCGHANICDDSISTDARSKGSLGGPTDTQHIDAEKKVLRKLNHIISKINRREFKGTNLSCVCEKCDGVPPWAHYPSIGGFVAVFIVGLLFIALTIALLVITHRPLVLLLLVLSSLFVYLGINACVSKRKRDRIMSQLTADQYPTIIIDNNNSRKENKCVSNSSEG